LLFISIILTALFDTNNNINNKCISFYFCALNAYNVEVPTKTKFHTSCKITQDTSSLISKKNVVNLSSGTWKSLNFVGGMQILKVWKPQLW